MKKIAGQRDHPRQEREHAKPHEHGEDQSGQPGVIAFFYGEFIG